MKGTKIIDNGNPKNSYLSVGAFRVPNKIKSKDPIVIKVPTEYVFFVGYVVNVLCLIQYTKVKRNQAERPRSCYKKD